MPPRSDPPGGPVPRQAVPWSARPLICALATLCALATSCASRSAKSPAKPPAKPSTTPVALALPVETRIGVVRAVGASERFVLIETPSASTASSLTEGQIIHCRPLGATHSVATADLQVSRERHQALVVANVVAGTPEVGAVVYAAPDMAPTASPTPGPVSSLSTAPLSSLFPPRKP